MNRIKAIAANPVVRRVVTAFVLAAAPLIVAAYEATGVDGITVAVVMAAIIAGLHAALAAFQKGARKVRHG